MIAEKFCTSCNTVLNEGNMVIIKTYVKGKLYEYARKKCRKCRSNDVMNGNKNNLKRKEYINNRSRRIGIVKMYPCQTCSSLCYKKYAKAFCSIKCRFLSFVDKTDDCWLWNGKRNKAGYGRFSFNRDNLYMAAHRSSFTLFKGEISEGLLICHSCDNPPCVNPDHLWMGTPKDNSQDCIKKGRFVGRKNKVERGVKSGL